MKLKGKIVLITGGAKRIGAEMAEQFAEKGADVLIHCRHSRKEADLLAKKIRKYGVKSHVYSADLSQIPDVKKMTQQILKDVGPVDVLVNNASLFYRTPFEKISEKNWDDFLSIHIKAPFFLAQALAPAMKKKGAGRIINIADWSGLRPYQNYLPYCVSKGGLITLTQALAKALAPEVLVTAVCPGPILPPEDLSPQEKAHVAKKTLIGKWGCSEDIARMVVFLAEQDFVTGSYHLVDGGESLRG
ncbi:MAG: SDR family NAD(P)-dependent oxidoreductase [Deltaproteobacteria bacterium]|nr:SDR family NAD(P)-dependent oxidoreductase [Deltaproteobacteria bacterium]